MELILEIGPADGDLSYAVDLVHAAKECGADWVKGQVYDRDLLTTRYAQTYAQEGITTPEYQYDDFEKQLTWDEWEKVKLECDRTGIGFFYSLFDLSGIRFGEYLGVERYKIASGDITYRQLIEAVAATGKLVIQSTGAATIGEVERAVGWLGHNYWLFACSLSYPTTPKDANLARMQTLRQFTPHVGYSDHTFGTEAIRRAQALGAVAVEKHFTLRPGRGGDHDFAVTPQQLQQMTRSGSTAERYDGRPELVPSQAEQKARVGARRSCVAAKDLQPGDPIGQSDILFLRPGTGIPPYEPPVGRYPKAVIPAGTVIESSMIL